MSRQQPYREENDLYDRLLVHKQNPSHDLNRNCCGSLPSHLAYLAAARSLARLQLLFEVRDFDFEKNLGDEITIDIFEEGEEIAVVGTSKGKGFQGVVKRHGFRGVGMQTHGQHNRGRAPGTIGMASTPSRVLKGQRMAGRMGTDRVKVKGLKIIKLIAEENLMVVKGSVPGHKGSYIIVEGK